MLPTWFDTLVESARKNGQEELVRPTARTHCGCKPFPEGRAGVCPALPAR